jgi:hypothetical protein
LIENVLSKKLITVSIPNFHQKYEKNSFYYSLIYLPEVVHHSIQQFSITFIHDYFESNQTTLLVMLVITQSHELPPYVIHKFQRTVTKFVEESIKYFSQMTCQKKKEPSEYDVEN